MMDCDRISHGWQVWLTPRQTRIIHAKLTGKPIKPEDEAHVSKLVEWFGAEVEAKAQARGDVTGV